MMRQGFVQEKALSIWLDVPLDELVRRVKKKPDKRPLLKDQNVEAKLTELMQIRAPIYGHATLKVDVGGGTHGPRLPDWSAPLTPIMPRDWTKPRHFSKARL